MIVIIVLGILIAVVCQKYLYSAGSALVVMGILASVGVKHSSHFTVVSLPKVYWSIQV